MENNKSEFKATGVYFDGATVHEIQISHLGDAARYRTTTKYACRPDEIARGRWQEIRYSKQNGYAYITMCGKKLYLHKFQRIY